MNSRKLFSRLKLFTLNSKLFTKLLLFTLLSSLFTSCRTTRNLEVVKQVRQDTIYMNRMQYDSIFIDNIHLVDRGKDTIIIQDAKVEYRFRLLKDTVRIHQVDSIPVVKEVEVTKTVTEQYIPWYIKVLAWTGAICIILLILYALYRYIVTLLFTHNLFS